MLTSFALLLLVVVAPRVHAGSINIMNLTSHPYGGYLIASNVWPGASYATSYEQYITIAPFGSFNLSDPTGMTAPSGLGLPAQASGLFIGLKFSCLDIGPNNGSVGKDGNYMGYPISQSVPPVYAIQWNPGGLGNVNALVLIM